MSATVSSAPVTYHGGQVQDEQNAYAIFWLPSGYTYDPTGSNSNYEFLISRYFEDIGGSSFYKLLVQYPDDINASPSATANFGGAFVDTTPYPHNGSLTNPLQGQDIQNEVQRIISSGSLPVGPDYSYYVFTANGTNSCENQQAGICSYSTTQEPQGYCAYHSYLTVGSSVVTYANILDNPSGNSNCLLTLSEIGASQFPNNDAYADTEISLVSQEQFDIVSDPLGSSWYDASSLEIGQKCTGDFGNVNSTYGYNIVLNNHWYIVQEEWSNSASTCTLAPPTTYSISLTLSAASSANSVSSSNYFPLTYAIGKQLFVVDYSGSALTIQADPNTSLSIAAMSYKSSSFERWCLDSLCQSYVISLSSPTQTASFYYYDMLAQSVFEVTSDNSQPAIFSSLSYSTGPTNAGSGDTLQMTSRILSSSPQTIWAERGSEASITSQTYMVSSSEQYYTPAESWSITAYDIVPAILSYHQFLVNYDYSILNGGTGYTPPTVSYVSEGQAETAAGGSQEWSDAGTIYSYDAVLTGSSTTQRWATQSDEVAGTIGSAETIQVAYYYQFALVLEYKVIGGLGSASAPKFTGVSFGTQISFTLTETPTAYWLDAGTSYSYNNPLSGSTSSERWYSTNTTSGTVNATTTLVPIYANQYSVSFAYSIFGGGEPPSQPTVIYSSFNGTNTLTLTGTPEPLWINAGSNYTVESAVGKNSTQRWAYNSGLAVANSSGTISVTLYHQFLLEFNVTYVGATTPPSDPLLNVSMFGQPVSVQFASTSPETIWLDAGSSYQFSPSLGQTVPGERWLTPAPSGVVDENGTVSVSYYQQYQISLEYSVTGGANPGGATGSFVSLGSPLNVNLNQTSGQIWADAGSKYSVSPNLAGSTTQVEWATTQSDISGVVASGLNLSVAYSYQVYVTIASNPPGAAVFTASSGWVSPGTDLVVQTRVPSGWQFEGWVGNGTGAYTGNSSSLSLTVTGPVQETATLYTALIITTSSTGTVSYSFGSVSGSVGYGATRTIFVPPNQVLRLTGDPLPVLFAFSYWKGNITGGPNATKTDLNPLTLQLTAPTAISITFKANLVGIITIAVVGAVGGVAGVMFLRRGRSEPETSDAEGANGENESSTLLKTDT
jgi:hypothetical protein